MQSSTIKTLRVYLLTASCAAMAIEVMALLAISLFGVSEDVFALPAFRAATVVAIAGVVVLTRLVAHAAFLSTLLHRYASFLGVFTQRWVRRFDRPRRT
ncbi:MAG: hypothetical protein RXR20_23765 [Paraburkholderia sp.]|jgi:hypothetical protein|uniref:hypothetical protein n=1 Tax=Burkholderiaceae TaxID=119060 RepID=UPI0010F859B7|nr:hypothetical protein [Burkholderia sp. 4M9327F10]